MSNKGNLGRIAVEYSAKDTVIEIGKNPFFAFFKNARKIGTEAINKEKIK